MNSLTVPDYEPLTRFDEYQIGAAILISSVFAMFCMAVAALLQAVG